MNLFKNIIDNIVIVGTIIGAIAAIIAAIKWFISLTGKRKENSPPEHERRSKITLEQCELFQKEIIPQYLEIIKFAHNNKIKIPKIVQFIDAETIKKPLNPHPKIEVFLDMVMSLFNNMDSFASYFVTNDIANEGLAYKAQGKAFCDIINKLHNIFKLFLKIKKEDYNNLSELYNIWSIKV